MHGHMYYTIADHRERDAPYSRRDDRNHVYIVNIVSFYKEYHSVFIVI